MTTPGQPSTTIVVVSYNHQKYLEQCLESVYCQTVQDLNVIVIDDASTDGTPQRLRSLFEERRWNAMVVLHEENRGICATFNEALALVRTPYVAFISADDWMDCRRVELQAEALDSSSHVAMVYSNMHLADADGMPTGMSYDQLFQGTWPRDDTGDLFCRLLEQNWIPAPSAMSRTECLRAVGGFDERLSFEDYDMWLKLANSGYDFAFVPGSFVYYRQHPQQLSHARIRADPLDSLSRARIFAKYIGVPCARDRDPEHLLAHFALLAYESGAPSGQVAPLLLQAGKALGSRRVLLWARLARMRIPGDIAVRMMHLVPAVNWVTGRVARAAGRGCDAA